MMRFAAVLWMASLIGCTKQADLNKAMTDQIVELKKNYSGHGNRLDNHDGQIKDLRADVDGLKKGAGGNNGPSTEGWVRQTWRFGGSNVKLLTDEQAPADDRDIPNRKEVQQMVRDGVAAGNQQPQQPPDQQPMPQPAPAAPVPPAQQPAKNWVQEGTAHLKDLNEFKREAEEFTGLKFRLKVESPEDRDEAVAKAIREHTDAFRGFSDDFSGFRKEANDYFRRSLEIGDRLVEEAAKEKSAYDAGLFLFKGLGQLLEHQKALTRKEVEELFDRMFNQLWSKIGHKFDTDLKVVQPPPPEVKKLIVEHKVQYHVIWTPAGSWCYVGSIPNHRQRCWAWPCDRWNPAWYYP